MSSFETFITTLENGIKATDRTGKSMVHLAVNALQPLLTNPHLLNNDYMWQLLQGHTEGLLYKSPHHGFIVQAFGWFPGSETPIHDHNTWGVMGIYRNQLQVTEYNFYETETPGVYDISERETYLSNQGKIAYILPPYDEIHRVMNVSPHPSVSIHIYGREIGDYNIFDLKNKQIRQVQG